jgi:hypothetical protein
MSPPVMGKFLLPIFKLISNLTLSLSPTVLASAYWIIDHVTVLSPVPTPIFPLTLWEILPCPKYSAEYNSSFLEQDSIHARFLFNASFLSVSIRRRRQLGNHSWHLVLHTGKAQKQDFLVYKLI